METHFWHDSQTRTNTAPRIELLFPEGGECSDVHCIKSCLGKLITASLRGLVFKSHMQAITVTGRFVCVTQTHSSWCTQSVSWLQSPRYASAFFSPPLVTYGTVLKILQKSVFWYKKWRSCSRQVVPTSRSCAFVYVCGCASSTENDRVLPDRLLFAATLFWHRTQRVLKPINVLMRFSSWLTQAHKVCLRPERGHTRVSFTTHE